MFQHRFFAILLLLTFVLLQINHALSQTPQYPDSLSLHQVSIRLLASDEEKFGDGHICSGTLISNFTILTSASCLLNDESGEFYKANQLRVVLGSSYRTKKDEKGSFMATVTSVRTHGRFHRRTYLNNIAILKVDLSDLDWGTDYYIAPVVTSREKITQDLKCYLYGWKSSSGELIDLLRQSKVFTKNREFCNQDEEQIFPFATFCSASAEKDSTLDTCVGEAGAGLICDNFLRGIVSRDCTGGITQYTDVSQVINWIALSHLDETLKLIDNEFLKHFVFSALDFAAYYINSPKIADDFEVLKFVF